MSIAKLVRADVLSTSHSSKNIAYIKKMMKFCFLIFFKYF